MQIGAPLLKQPNTPTLAMMLCFVPDSTQRFPPPRHHFLESPTGTEEQILTQPCTEANKVIQLM